MSTRSDGSMRVNGALSDGRSATASPVVVSLGGTDLEIRAAAGAPVWRWPYAELRSSVPLRAKAADVLLSRQPAGAETLFVTDPAFAGELLRRAPALSAGRQRWHGLRPGLAATAAVLALVIGARIFELQPAQAMARLMPQQTREVLGRNVVASIAKDHRACETAASRAALDRLTRRLTAATPRPMQVHVMLLDWQIVNAFALPGGQIILSRGLVQGAVSPDEVAGVLAHELGHAIELHPETGIVRAMGLAAATQLVFAGSAGTVSNLGLFLTQLRYTRIAEREADMHAVRLLRGAEISAQGLGDFLERLEGKARTQAGDKQATNYEVISTHPPTAERIAMVRAQPAYAATPSLSPEDWRALREACGPAAVSPPDAAAADREIAEATKTLQANPNDVAALQKRGRAHARKRQHDQALADFTRAVELKPRDAALRSYRGQAYQNLRRYEEALHDYDEAIRLVPNHVAARNGRANTNRALKRYEAALTDFDQLVRFNPKFAVAYYNRALVYIDMKQPDDAIRDLTQAIAVDKDYAGAYTQRGLLHEKLAAPQLAIADFRAALAAPPKFESGAWAHRTARDRLQALGVAVQ